MSKSTKAEPTHYGRPSLKLRGWTDALIAKFLPAPDLLAPNPHYSSGPPRKLYLIGRVEAAEATDAWNAAKEGATKRVAAARKATETKRSAMREHLARLSIEVPAVGRDELIRLACGHYNRRQDELAMRRAERGQWDRYDERRPDPATPKSSPAFLERIAANYLRHRLSAYEDELEAAHGKVGVAEAYAEISAKVFAAIGETHPWLAAECGRQMESRKAPGAGTGATAGEEVPTR